MLKDIKMHANPSSKYPGLHSPLKGKKKKIWWNFKNVKLFLPYVFLFESESVQDSPFVHLLQYSKHGRHDDPD